MMIRKGRRTTITTLLLFKKISKDTWKCIGGDGDDNGDIDAYTVYPGRNRTLD